MPCTVCDVLMYIRSCLQPSMLSPSRLDWRIVELLRSGPRFVGEIEKHPLVHQPFCRRSQHAPHGCCGQAGLVESTVDAAAGGSTSSAGSPFRRWPRGWRLPPSPGKATSTPSKRTSNRLETTIERERSQRDPRRAGGQTGAAIQAIPGALAASAVWSAIRCRRVNCPHGFRPAWWETARWVRSPDRFVVSRPSLASQTLL